MVVRLAKLPIDAPLLGRRLLQHRAHRRTHLPIGWMWWRMLREPSVSWLPYFGSSPGAWTIFTRAQSASISSASTIGRLVREPVPISERCATMVTVPSGSIETNTSGLVMMPFGMSRPPVWYGSNALRGPEGQELHGDDQAGAPKRFP